MLIGDQQVLTQQSSGKPLEPELFNQLKKLEWLEVIDAGQWNFTPAQVYERKIKFSVFDSGYFRIPSLEVRIDSQKISTEPLDLRVDLAVDSTAELLPIKDIVLTREPGYRWIFCRRGHHRTACAGVVVFPDACGSRTSWKNSLYKSSETA